MSLVTYKKLKVKFSSSKHQTVEMEFREIEMELTWKLPPWGLPLTVMKGTMETVKED